jgi:ribosomal protein S18 acetylase RimI-like enzyme
VRPARLRDARAIFEIHLASLEGLDEEDYEWFEAMIKVRSRRRKVLVAELGGEVVGFAIAYRYGDLAYIDSIAVKPEARGAGVGSKLLAELERALKSDGAELVALSVKDGNKRALDFYLRNGYSLKGVILLLSSPVASLPSAAAEGFEVRRRRAGSLSRLKRFKPSTWWSTLTEPVDRLIYKRFIRGEEALVAYKGRRVKGVLEYSLDSELYADYIALSSYTALDALRTLLAGVKSVGLEAGVSTVTVPVDASKKLLVEALLKSGFRTVGSEYLAVKELA